MIRIQLIILIFSMKSFFILKQFSTVVVIFNMLYWLIFCCYSVLKNVNYFWFNNKQTNNSLKIPNHWWKKIGWKKIFSNEKKNWNAPTTFIFLCVCTYLLSTFFLVIARKCLNQVVWYVDIFLVTSLRLDPC